jgi:sarcosine oxidase
VRSEADVAVVGAGVVGLAAARALARAGRSVVVLEQFRVGHVHGSSHGTSRIFRLAYAEAEYVELAQRVQALWRELELETGERILEATGSLDVGGDLDPFVRALDESGVQAEVLDGAALRRRWPRLHLPDDRALYHADGGVLHANRALAALRSSVLAVGVRLREQTTVRSLEHEDGAVVLETTAGPMRVGAAVVAAGAWAPRLAELPVTVTRETVAHFRLAGTDVLPTIIDRSPPTVQPSRSHQAAYALLSPVIGIKAGVHRSGAEVDPDTVSAPDEAVVRATAAWLSERFPLATPKPALLETCLYTSTPDERFVLERRGRVVVASACSGHGFKFAPENGRRIAELAGEALAD